jgi:DNA-binding transcriptional regulator LsrR (DeoR family)
MGKSEYQKGTGWAKHKIDYEKALKLFKMGVDINSIAERLGCSREKIRDAIKEARTS